MPPKISDIAKIIIDKDHKGNSIGRAWFSSIDRHCLFELIKAHNKVSNFTLDKFSLGLDVSQIENFLNGFHL